MQSVNKIRSTDDGGLLDNSTESGCYNKNTVGNKRKKASRLSAAAAAGQDNFIHIESTLKGKIKWFYKKNMNHAVDYTEFLNNSKPQITNILNSMVSIHPIKYNLKLEVTYSIPQQDKTSEKRAFKTSARELYSPSDLNTAVLDDFKKLLEEEDDYPLRVSDTEKPNHYDLLLVEDETSDLSHYTYITNFVRLIHSQKIKNHSNMVFCKKCFTGFDICTKLNKLSGQEALDQHAKICNTHKTILPVMPEAGSVLKFDAWGKTVRHPFVIYADFEALLIKPDISDSKSGNTNIVEEHKLMSYGFFVKAADNILIDILKQYSIPLTPIWFCGSQTINSEEVAKRFVEAIVEVATNISALLQTNTPIKFTDTEAQRHAVATCCEICHCSFTQSNQKIADHDHLCGKFNTCNLKLRTPNFIPVFFHSLSHYDAHFIVTQLGFLDSCRFTPSSLSALTTDLAKAGLSNFQKTAKVFCSKDIPLMTKKGVFPYSFVDEWSNFEVTSLPAREQFNSLTGEHISIQDYEHAVQVWNHFQLFYFTSPGLSFDAMLKHSMVHLDLLNDYEMVLLIENGTCGGLVQACTRWAKANNPKTPGYNPDKPNTWLIYQDATNLYGYAMICRLEAFSGTPEAGKKH
ncbi:uncharacterized protein LOC126845988 [Adelges cooleyi]|uniref:uncharacterized protein LOC126845988 n=1 Tax=Adelges cooleyi TaxID=133065 RepID=UPI00217FDA45|nr:uncharacterized protein LOC126845988 [Adelges cooleyi]